MKRIRPTTILLSVIIVVLLMILLLERSRTQRRIASLEGKLYQVMYEMRERDSSLDRYRPQVYLREIRRLQQENAELRKAMTRTSALDSETR